ncbi:MAG: hypothetical protein A2015_12075 [Spirochaetes bacterium GWF1_31_7]|nr:MAG: hypothetical protein A2Y30_15000 [Spirochaetes bacterium GWE1_32_154]OHD49153.1 MAG: hypothetical protein A2015_12075 [Spirochaetes bacterium GWF1_31_7]OHD50262.1 MAG: hypothetical protein A2Y29_13050 [Spirochaetes bacterium GWE2_31_10]OHD76598.1 MAG: hypothetical protein A2355_13505 [Spirochaetes bacterium RIFOXYB1_FULL_32_8]HBD93955.1 DNA-binding response regulator [Spirochaetia bacterium]
MSGERVLIVDDEKEIRDLIAKYLRKENMEITEADSGEKALSLIHVYKYDLVILDIMMGGIDGFEVVRKVRSDNDELHIMILSAREEDYDKVLGFGLGADDYMTKPFSPFELVARVKSHLRRTKLIGNRPVEQNIPESVTRGVFTLDSKSYTLIKEGVNTELSAKEFKLFRFLFDNPDRVYTKQQIYENVWDDGYYDENTLMVYINHLRNKIEDKPEKPQFIKTVWGVGYKFTLESVAKGV